MVEKSTRSGGCTSSVDPAQPSWKEILREDLQFFAESKNCHIFFLRGPRKAQGRRIVGMPRLTIGLGAVLIVLGIIAYIVTGMASVTALIPSFLGVVVLACGLIGLRSPKIGIHIALVVALVGIAGTARNVFSEDLLDGRPAAIFSAITMALLVIYIITGVRSFIAARRWKREEAQLSS